MFKTAAVLFLSLSAAAVQADVITFPESTVIHQTAGTGGTVASEYVEIGGYRFEASGNNFSIYGGGLWDGGAFGIATAILITRVDGGLFSLDSVTMQGHAGYACYQGYCGQDSVTFAGYTPGVSYPTWAGFSLNGYVGTDNVFNVADADPAFGNLEKVWIDETESFILKSVTLHSVSAVPLPAPIWLMGAGLLTLAGRFRRKSAKAG
jgi:hypothetical protein